MGLVSLKNFYEIRKLTSLVKPSQVIDVQSLAGDSSDNIPGVPGIGIKTAAELINKYNNLDTLLKKATEIKQNVFFQKLKRKNFISLL